MKKQALEKGKKKREKRIVLAAGGTGGHIYPAIVIARNIKENYPHWRVLFVGAKGGMEEEIFRKEDLSFKTVPVRGLKGKRWTQKLMNLLILPLGIAKALAIIISFKPNLVMGFGGYPSAPAVLSAIILRRPVIIIEQNLYPGFTNRFLSRFSRAAAVSFEESKSFLKGRVVVAGNPVREEFYRIKSRVKGRRVNLLIFGGSQGAHTINLLMLSALPLLREYRDRLKIIHQSGKKELQWVTTGYEKEGFNARVVPFIYNMAEEFQKADLILCRAGASTIAELAAAGKAAILIPLAGSANGHQRLNAESLARQGAAVALWEDLTGERLAKEIINLIGKPGRIKQIEEAVRNQGKPEAAQKIVELAQEIMA